MSDQSVSDQSVSEQSVSAQSVSEQSVSEQSVSDQSSLLSRLTSEGTRGVSAMEAEVERRFQHGEPELPAATTHAAADRYMPLLVRSDLPEAEIEIFS